MLGQANHSNTIVGQIVGHYPTNELVVTSTIIGYAARERAYCAKGLSCKGFSCTIRGGGTCAKADHFRF